MKRASSTLTIRWCVIDRNEHGPWAVLEAAKPAMF